jgi:hypothetical protein
MTEDESEAVADYLARYEKQIKKQLDILHERMERLTGLRPVWDPMAQGYLFEDPTGMLRVNPEINRKARRQMFGWFGNKNNKGKKWPESRRNRSKLDALRPG